MGFKVGGLQTILFLQGLPLTGNGDPLYAMGGVNITLHFARIFSRLAQAHQVHFLCVLSPRLVIVSRACHVSALCFIRHLSAGQPPALHQQDSCLAVLPKSLRSYKVQFCHFKQRLPPCPFSTAHILRAGVPLDVVPSLPFYDSWGSEPFPPSHHGWR